MSELRKDPILDHWVIIAAERGYRPSDFKAEVPMAYTGAGCPFCEGNEDKTPPEVFALRAPGTAPNQPGWEVRVVPNRYPALTIEGDLNRRGLGMFDMMNGVGAHEVIIETPFHDRHLADLPVEQVVKVLIAYKARIEDLRRDLRFRYILVFRNHGWIAGASLSHPHSQLIALAITPRLVKEELTAAREHFARKERCIFCDLLNQERALGERVVFETKHFIVLSPFASRFPFEVSIFPLEHSHDFTLMGSEIMEDFARTLKETLLRLKQALADPAYNFLLHTAPNPVPRPGRPEYWGTLAYDYHWHLEIMPRLTRVAGFEWGTGFYINPVAPEEATRFLREVAAED